MNTNGRASARQRMIALLGVTILAGAVASAGSASPAQAASFVPISGSGSTWSQSAIDQFRVDVRQNAGMTVNYSGTGASAGRRDFIQGTVDFAVSELPFQSNPEDGSAPEVPKTGFTYLPATAGATSIMYNLKIGSTRLTDLRLSGKTLAKIFTGAIIRWNDPAIAADNPRLTMPDMAITPIVRSDGSGSTKQFTQWIATEYPQLWSTFCTRVGRAANCGATAQFPSVSNMKAQSGSLGVAGYVAASYGEGSLTYVENSYALRTGIPTAKILNKAGYYTAPTADAVSVALLGTTINTEPSSPGYRTANLTAVYEFPDSRAYPLAYYDYYIVPTAVGGIFTAAKAATLGAFLRYSLCAGQSRAESLGYAALPINLVADGLAQVDRIPGATDADFTLADCANPTFRPGETTANNALLSRAAQPAASDAGVADEPSNPGSSLGLVVQTLAATDGELSLSIDANAEAVFAAPQLVAGISVTHGQLPRFTVSDARVVSQPGWDLTANVADFVNEADAGVVITSEHVGIATLLVGSTATGVQVAPAQSGGSAHYPAAIASAATMQGAGDTILTGELTLVAPADHAAGVYRSVLTLTVISR